MPANVQTPNIQYQQRAGLSPEAKSTLMTGAMASVLGATWLAPAKIGGADNLLSMAQDKFESATKAISKLKDDAEEKQALEYFKGIREDLANKHVKQADKLFGTATEIKAEDLFKGVNSKITTPKKADAFTRLLEMGMNKIEKTKELLLSADVAKNGVTAETHAAFDKLFEGKMNAKQLNSYKEAFKSRFPIGSTPTPENITAFLKEHKTPLSSQYWELSALKRVANCAENGVITRANAEKAFLRYNKDASLDIAQGCFETMKSKLPKARFKSAAKWFGYGIGIAILSNIAFSFLGSFFTKKK